MKAPHLNRSMAKGIVLYWGGDPAQQLGAMRMLGLIGDERGPDGLFPVLPDDTKTHEIDTLNDKPFDREGLAIPDRRITDSVPPGLRDFGASPPAPAPKAAPKAKTKTKPKARPERRAEDVCGTGSGRAFHRNRDEPLCDACRAWQAAYKHEWGRGKRRQRTAEHLPPPGTRCGTPTGRQDHYIRGEKPCETCRIDHNRRQRERTAKNNPQNESEARGQHPPPVEHVPNQLDIDTEEERSA